jgi:uncharacterized protein YecE (DUF72 family)
VEGWVEQTPEPFVFSVKASRYLTHVKRLKLMEVYVERFYRPLQAMRGAGKLGPVLWQLPENFKRDDERLAAALAQLPEGRHCFEFRHASWFAPDVYALMREHNVALVIGDDPTRPFQSHERTADFTFVRFHRSTRRRSGNYSPGELETWVRRIAQWRRKTEVFAYFNNDWKGYAIENARRLKSGLGI